MSVIYSVSGGLGERNNERNPRSSVEAVCKPAGNEREA